jgi:hypothetical protein
MDPHYGQPCKIIMDPGPLQYAGYAQICAGLFFWGGRYIPFNGPYAHVYRVTVIDEVITKSNRGLFPVIIGGGATLMMTTTSMC